MWKPVVGGNHLPQNQQDPVEFQQMMENKPMTVWFPLSAFTTHIEMSQCALKHGKKTGSKEKKGAETSAAVKISKRKDNGLVF